MCIRDRAQVLQYLAVPPYAPTAAQLAAAPAAALDVLGLLSQQPGAEEAAAGAAVRAVLDANPALAPGYEACLLYTSISALSTSTS